jgi:hypothetical protein
MCQRARSAVHSFLFHAVPDAIALSPSAGSSHAWSAVVHLALLGLAIALVGLVALMLWTTLRWMRRRLGARREAKLSSTGLPSPWVQAGQRQSGPPTPTPWPSIPNPNLRDPVQRMIEREDDALSLDETTPLSESSQLDDTRDLHSGLHDTSDDEDWEFESPGDDAPPPALDDTNHDTNDLTRDPDQRDDDEDSWLELDETDTEHDDNGFDGDDDTSGGREPGRGPI